MQRDKIKNKININKKHWIHFRKTNCYAYALGLDIREKRIMANAFQPGTISQYDSSINSQKIFTYDQLINSIYSDMEYLNIDIQPIAWNEKVDVDAWKIALFVSYYSRYSENLDDFHFLRQFNDKLWYHKMGYNSLPINKDDNNFKIVNPEQCYLRNRVYKGSYCLKLKRGGKYDL